MLRVYGQGVIMRTNGRKKVKFATFNENGFVDINEQLLRPDELSRLKRRFVVKEKDQAIKDEENNLLKQPFSDKLKEETNTQHTDITIDMVRNCSQNRKELAGYYRILGLEGDLRTIKTEEMLSKIIKKLKENEHVRT